MKRFHVHVAVNDLDESVRFYSKVFGSEPAVLKPDYAKWMVEDPRLNFAISARGSRAGIDHLGLQVDSDDELAGMREQLLSADGSLMEERAVNCCYAKSDKYWVTDPQGIAWETWHNLDSVPVYGSVSQVPAHASTDACRSTSSAAAPTVPAVNQHARCCS